MSSIMRRRRGLKSAISKLLSEGVGSNTHILSARRRSTPLCPPAAAAASFNPQTKLQGLGFSASKNRLPLNPLEACSRTTIHVAAQFGGNVRGKTIGIRTQNEKRPAGFPTKTIQAVLPRISYDVVGSELPLSSRMAPSIFFNFEMCRSRSSKRFSALLISASLSASLAALSGGLVSCS
jgi:hypothetical protein